ncbi:MAG: peptidoglycan-binding protein [Firmicutes bacterium]|nr:peptidoglycan-binding protein [Bacillota bacterium]
MEQGYLIVQVIAAEGALPIENAKVRVFSLNNVLLYEQTTDVNGNTSKFALDAPDSKLQQSIETAKNAYTQYNVLVGAKGFTPILIEGVTITGGSESVLPVNLHPLCDGRTENCGYEYIQIPPPLCAEDTPPQLQHIEPASQPNVPYNSPADSPIYYSPQEWIEDGIEARKKDHYLPPINPVGSVARYDDEYFPLENFGFVDSMQNPELRIQNQSMSNNMTAGSELANMGNGLRVNDFSSPSNNNGQAINYNNAGMQNRPSAGNEPIVVDDTITTAIVPTAFVEERSQPISIAPRLGASPGAHPAQALGPIFLPEFVRVKLGLPTSNAPVVRVPFIDYIKNVTSSEIFDTWPRSSMLANIHVIVTFLLNRIYSEWYPSRGHNFDITSTTQHDQRFIYGRNIFANIDRLVDEVYNVFARRVGFANPYFTEYCNGTTATCRGLSQWGTVTLANRGYTPLRILQFYYHNDMRLEETNLFQSVVSSYPGTPLRIGSQGPDVLRIQNFLNRIRTNFPAIPTISPPNGSYQASTAASVRAFQQSQNMTADGVVGLNTWNRITRIYVAVIRLSELGGEAERVGLSPNPPTVIIRQGDRGVNVAHLQYILDMLSRYYANIPAIIRDSSFGANTRNAVLAFQRMVNINPDGVVGPVTWNRLYQAYRGMTHVPSLPPVPPPGIAPPAPGPQRPYPGVVQRVGARGENVRWIQESINIIRRVYPAIPALTEDGVFGSLTQNAVIRFQQTFALVPDGLVGPMTWAKLNDMRNQVTGGTAAPQPPTGGQPPQPPGANIPAYPGHLIQEGARGDSVRQIQEALNTVRRRFPQIRQLNVDGVFGPLTRASVIAFQAAMGLVQDGIIGPITWRALMEMAADFNAPMNFNGTLLTVGSRGEDVRLMQQLITDLSRQHASIPVLNADGVFGPITQGAVRDVQRTFGLNADGIIGPNTWGRIVSEWRRL